MLTVITVLRFVWLVAALRNHSLQGSPQKILEVVKMEPVRCISELVFKIKYIKVNNNTACHH